MSWIALPVANLHMSVLEREEALAFQIQLHKMFQAFERVRWYLGNVIVAHVEDLQSFELTERVGQQGAHLITVEEQIAHIGHVDNTKRVEILDLVACTSID